MESIFNYGENPYQKLNNKELQKIQDFIKDYFDYTITISVTESEWLSHFDWLETYIIDRETNADDYHIEALKDLLFDLFFNQNRIKEQIENDLENYSDESEEFKDIKKFYKKWENLFNFKIEKLEVEQDDK